MGPDTTWPEEWSRRSRDQKQKAISSWDDEKTGLQEARRQRGVFDVSPEDNEYLKVDLRSSKTRKVRAPLNAVHSPNGCSAKTEAVNVSKRARTEEKPQELTDHISQQRIHYV